MGQHDFLAQKPKQIAVGLHERRSLPAQQMCLELAHVTGEQRRKRKDEQHLAELNRQFEDYCHAASTVSSTTSALNTRVR